MAFIPWAIVKRATPSFGNEFDTQGFPITGSCELECSSAFVATKSLVAYWQNQANNMRKDAIISSIEGLSPQQSWSGMGSPLAGGGTWADQTSFDADPSAGVLSVDDTTPPALTGP
jgi:hypothetical protein